MMFRVLAIALAATGGAAPRAVHAETAAAPGIAISQVTSLLVSLLVVLAAIAAVAWLVKRFAPRSLNGTGLLRVVAGAAVGPRERVVVVEIGSTWLVVGVAPGQVNMLQQIPRPEHSPEPDIAPAAGPASFAAWLKKLTAQRNER